MDLAVGPPAADLADEPDTTFFDDDDEREDDESDE